MFALIFKENDHFKKDHLNMIIRRLYSFLNILKILFLFFFVLKGCDNEWICGGKITKYQGLELETFHEKIVIMNEFMEEK